MTVERFGEKSRTTTGGLGGGSVIIGRYRRTVVPVDYRRLSGICSLIESTLSSEERSYSVVSLILLI